MSYATGILCRGRLAEASADRSSSPHSSSAHTNQASEQMLRTSKLIDLVVHIRTIETALGIAPGSKIAIRTGVRIQTTWTGPDREWLYLKM